MAFSSSKKGVLRRECHTDQDTACKLSARTSYRCDCARRSHVASSSLGASTNSTTNDPSNRGKGPRRTGCPLLGSNVVILALEGTLMCFSAHLCKRNCTVFIAGRIVLGPGLPAAPSCRLSLTRRTRARPNSASAASTASFAFRAVGNAPRYSEHGTLRFER